MTISRTERATLIAELRAVAAAPTMQPTWRIRSVCEQAADELEGGEA